MSSNRCDQAPTALRHIAVHVDQGEDGWFRWVLIEQSAPGSKWADLCSAELRFKTCSQAMAAGLLALQGLIEALDVEARKFDEAEKSRRKNLSTCLSGDALGGM